MTEREKSGRGVRVGSGSSAGHQGTVASLPAEDLSRDRLLASAPRIRFGERDVPSLGGIPLLVKLGRGGMGGVYLGFKPLLQREVAVKILPLQLAAEDDSIIERFLREARIAARIESPHLIRVTDVNQEAGLFYLVMEFVAGNSAGW